MSFTKTYYKRITPTSTIFSKSTTGAGLAGNNTTPPQALAQFQYSIGKNSYCDMTKSFFVLRDSLRKTDGNKIDTNIRRVFNHPSTLINVSREYANQSLICSVNQFPQTDTLLKRNISTYSKSYRETVGIYQSLESDAQKNATSADKIELEWVFKPDASSLFQIDHLYTGDYKIEFDLNTNDFWKRAIDTPANGDAYLYDIVNFDLYIYVVEDANDYPTGPVAYYVQEPRGFAKNLPSGLNQNIVVSIEPSIKNLIYALQQKNASSDTSIELTKFVQGATTSAFTDNLQNQYIIYNGENIHNNRNFSVLNTTQEVGHKFQGYINSLFNKTALSPCGNGETWNDYKANYGPYYNYQIPTDPSNINNQLEINLEFSSDTSCDIYAVLLHTAKINVNYDANGNQVGVPQKVYVDNPSEKLVEVVKQIADQPNAL